jgi:hypothetical protein
MKKTALFMLTGAIVGMYTTFVIQCLWNWFVSPAFHISEVSFWGMYGLVLLIGLFRENYGNNFADEQKWKGIAIMLDACIPEPKKDEVGIQMDQLTQVGIWVDAGFHVFGQIAGNTFTLVLGFVGAYSAGVEVWFGFGRLLAGPKRP